MSTIFTIITTISQVGATIGIFVTALIMLVSVIIMRQSVVATERASQGQLLAEHIRRYSDEKMYDALTLLWEERERFGEDKKGMGDWEKWIGNWKEAVSTMKKHGENEFMVTVAQAREIDKRRRRVTHHFTIPLQMKRVGLINEKVLKEMCLQDSLKIMFAINEWLERAKNPTGYTNIARKEFDDLLKICCDQEYQDKYRRLRPPFTR